MPLHTSGAGNLAASANPYAAGAQALGSAIAGGPSSSGDISDRSIINIAPVGTNIGEILQPAIQGAAANGGAGFRLPSRYAQAMVPGGPSAGSLAPSVDDLKRLPLWVLGVALVGGLGAFWLARRS